VSCRRGKHQTHPDAVGTEFLYQLERIRGIPQRFRHLASYLIAHDTSEIYIFKRLIASELITGHNHSGNPEEDYVGTCHKIGSRIVVPEVTVFRLKDSVEQGYRPEPA
jgi:hypothetical protein